MKRTPTCKECLSTVEWKLIHNRWQCLNPDGSDHWDLCSSLRWKIIATKGKPFKESHGSGFIYKGKKHYAWIKSKYETKPTQPIEPCGRDSGECTQPPWERCLKACPNAIGSL